VGDLHWLVETAHLAVGFGAVALIGTISARLVLLKQSAGHASEQPQPQSVR
jgi:hypothetical protein